MNAYVGIDASISSTAICVETDTLTKYLCYYKGKLTKWHKILNSIVEYHEIKSTNKDEDYSILELYKVIQYHQIAIHAAERVKQLCGDSNIRVGMEGYSYSSMVGPLIDLVTLGSAIRYRMLKTTQDVTIYSPSTMKLETAKLVYPPTITGVRVKKYMWRNNQMVPGGSFEKQHMLLAMFEQNATHPLKTVLLPYKNELMAAKKIPKPIDDIVDSFWACQVKKNNPS